MLYKEILNQVAKSNNIPVDVVVKVYNTYWNTIRDIIQKLPLKENITEEEFNILKPNINIHGLGKFFVLYPKYVQLKKKYQLIQKIKNAEDKVN